MRKLVQLALLAAVASGAFAVSGCGPHADMSAGVAVGPPIPPEAGLYYDDRSGYVWIEGRWVWDGYEYRWQPGQWIEARPGYVYLQGYWDFRANHYYWTDGYWEPMRPGHVYRRGNWGWRDGRRVWQRGRWEPSRKGHSYQPGYWDRAGTKRVWREGQWKRSQPKVRDHRPRRPEKVPSRRGTRPSKRR